MIITLAGTDRRAVTARLQRLLQEHDAGPESLNYSRLPGTEVSVEQLRLACDALPFLGGIRLVVVDGLIARLIGRGGEGDEPGATPAADRAGLAAFSKQLADYLPLVPQSSLLVLVEPKPLPQTGLGKLLRSVGTYQELNLPLADDLPRYIRDAVREQGAEIDRAAADLLAQVALQDPERIPSELDKLLLYSSGGKITEHAVRLLVDIPLELQVWDVTNAVYARDAGRALPALRRLLANSAPPQQLLAAIASQLRNLVAADGLRGRSPDALAQATGMKPWQAKRCAAALRNFDAGEPGRLLGLLAQLDVACKTGKAELSSALEGFVVAACTRGGSAAYVP